MTTKTEARPLANFAPSIWSDYFCSLVIDDMMLESHARRVAVLKENVKEMLLGVVHDPLQKIILIDLLTSLGIAYHFKSEIETQLEEIFNAQLDTSYSNYDLYSVALVFRVLRQHGYNISCDVFNKFLNAEGKFEEGICSDIKGMLSLYEAAHLRTHGEHILEEALEFATTNLKHVANKLSRPLAKEVLHALEHPRYKCVPRVFTRHFISLYQDDVSRNEILLELAKTDFNRLQLLHQQEIAKISRWWKDQATKFPFARDRVVELYFWANTIYFEPNYSHARVLLSQLIILMTLVDDIYDAYGTLEELQKFTSAMKRWDINAATQLPDYMKIAYGSILNFFEDLENEFSQGGESYMLHCAKEELQKASHLYYQEAKLFRGTCVPGFDQYMEIAQQTACGRYVMAAAFLGMGNVAEKELADWLSSYPEIVKKFDFIGRLLNDIVSAFERKREHIPSAVECYMKQYNVEENQAKEVLKTLVSNAWKDSNQEYLNCSVVSKHLLLLAVNYARIYTLMYKYGDGITDNQVMKNCLSSLFIEKI